MYSILLVEDDKTLAESIYERFHSDNVEINMAFNGNVGYRLARSKKFDLIILDIILPGKNGFEIARDLRQTGIDVPILMLTGRNETDNIVSGLNFGADGYLTKPFNVRELKARIENLLKRPPRTRQQIYKIADLELDPNKLVAKRDGKIIPLRQREFHILKYLLENIGTIVSREQIINNVWPFGPDSIDANVDVHISLLRKKIDKGFKQKLIHTKHSIGYFIKNPT